MRKTYGLAAILLLPILWVEIGCQQESTINPLDTELEEKLTTTSFTGEVSYYKLPDSDDYAAIPQDPQNPITAEKVKLGKLIFHEAAFGTEGKFAGSFQKYSCASCHNAKAGFQAGVLQGIADGGVGFGTYGESRTKGAACPSDSLDVQPIRSVTILNTAYQKVMRWNGSMGATSLNSNTQSQWTVGTPFYHNNLGYEGLETQSFVGLGGHRQKVDSVVQADSTYKAMFDDVFANEPIASRYTNLMAGLAMAAYSRTVLANQAPFQLWLEGDKEAMTDNQKEGALLFFGKAGCYRCHNGPSLATESFHALGLKDLYQVGGSSVYQANVNSLENKGRGGFTGNQADLYKFKVPQLYNVKDSPIFGHGGSFSSVKDMVTYKNNAVAENPNVATSQLSPMFMPLGLTDGEIDKIVDFVENALHDPNLERYVPHSTPSGLCFPNGDAQSRTDLGCN